MTVCSVKGAVCSDKLADFAVTFNLEERFRVFQLHHFWFILTAAHQCQTRQGSKKK